ncbi:AAA family ATPase [Magnetospirillum sp. UT-4]|uniref:AAA family ATPase n=1 Tax=Magnetospirillum sp. UT-4 TaxID=2681467 RepID=UPI00138298FD|nr:AAA family ATPase [Magnetospirillum sp. UT-4]CAA7612729.1 AAA ATPase [Magnetospirillum sp. UT-4]
MYKEFFNLSAEPFRITPDPGFLYLTDQHKEALAAIIYGIAKRKGFICITGEVGVGKTTILRSYLDSVDEPGLRFVYVFNPNVSFQALLRHIFKEIGHDYPGDDIASMVDSLRGWLMERHRKRETLVLLIDEAQNMPIGTLESLRMLSNLETATEKLVQIVLVGQPELEQLLGERQLRQLESRIAVRTRLGPLSRKDAAAYVRHRVKCVALDDRPAFSDAAVTEIVRHADGIPRRINVLADNALMTAFGRKLRPVPVKVVREVVVDLRLKEGGRRRRLRPWSWRWLTAAGAATAAVAAVAVLLPDPPALPPAKVVVHLPKPDSEQLPKPESVQLTAPLPPLAAPISVGMPAAATLPDISDAPDTPRRTVRIVAPGDTLAGLSQQVYGRYDGTLLDLVKRHNPAIVDVDRIQVGQMIEFPAKP